VITSAYNAQAHALVVVCWPAAEYPAKLHEELMAAIQKADDQGAARNHSVAIMLVLDPGAPAPGATWRQRYAEQRAAMRSPRVCISIVTQSMVLRGVLTAMNWLKPEPPHVKSAPHSTIQESIAWHEATRGTRIPELASLCEHARANAGTAVSRTG
jgi:hypothetical protein